VEKGKFKGEKVFKRGNGMNGKIKCRGRGEKRANGTVQSL
jgi:hypothetical protein